MKVLSYKSSGIFMIFLSVLIAAAAFLLYHDVPEPESLEKIGKIKGITFVYPIPGDCCSMPLTCIAFEDGDALKLYNILDIEGGKTYRIVYQKQNKPYINADPTDYQYRTAIVNVVAEIKEIFP